MKNKVIEKQIDASHDLLDTIGKKGKVVHSGKTGEKIKSLSKNLKALMDLQREVQKLKHELKSKKKKLIASLEGFTLSQKELKKAFRKDKEHGNKARLPKKVVRISKQEVKKAAHAVRKIVKP